MRPMTMPTFSAQRVQNQGHDFTLRELNQSDYVALRGLHNTIVADLAQCGKGSFFLEKSEGALRSCLAEGQNCFGATVRLFDGDMLIGAGSVTFPTAPEHIALIELPNGLRIHELSELRSSTIHPAYRGRSLHTHLVQSRLCLIEEVGRIAVSEYDVRNAPSMAPAMKAGLFVEFACKDPEDGADLVYAVRRPNQQPCAHDRPHSRLTRAARRWADLKMLLEQGFVGTAILRDGTMHLHRAPMGSA